MTTSTIVFDVTSGTGVLNTGFRNTVLTLMRSCSESGDLQQGESIQQQVLQSPALRGDVFILNHLLQMFGDCGSPALARSTFDMIPHRNVFSWNIMIAAYAANGHHQQALDLFWRMNCQPTKVTFVNVLAACAGLGDFAALDAVQSRIDPKILENDVVVGTAIITAAGKCDHLNAASHVFDRMQRRDVVCFNAMIAAAAKCGEFCRALLVFRRMLLEGVPPTATTLLGFVAECRDLELAHHLRNLASETGADGDLNACNALITMYAGCGSCSDAWKIFQWMRNKDVISWNAMITAFSQCGDCARALELSRFMDLEGVKFEEVTFIVMLGACNEFEQGVEVQCRAEAAGMSRLRVVQTATLSMFGRCGKVDLALEVFSRMEIKEQTSFNAIISVLVQHGKAEVALVTFERMRECGVDPNRVTFINLLEACATAGSLSEAKRIHACMDRQMLESDTAIATLTVNMFGCCGGVDEAEATFNSLKNRTEACIWNAMIGAYSVNSEPQRGVHLLRVMDLEGVKADEVSFVSLLSACEDLRAGEELHSRITTLGLENSDLVIATSLVSMYSRCGDLTKGTEVFNRMKVRDTVSWNAMVSGFAAQGAVDQSMQLVLQMDLEGMQAGESALAAMTSSCQGLSQAREVHKFVDSTGVNCGVFLIHMYTRCGCPDQAREVFDGMNKSSVGTWNSILAAYAQNGRGVEEICGMFWEMNSSGVDPDDVTFINVLSALTHAGLLSRSRECFTVMVGDFGVDASVEHYGCLINLLARAGKLKQAEDLLGGMPCKPDAMVWTSLLSASTMHSQDHLAEQFAKSAVKSDPRSAAPYVLFSNAIRHT